jgi:DNA modification methylase
MLRDGETHRLIRSDCLQAVVEAMSDVCIDCVIGDPPYCSGAIGEAQRTRAPGQGLRSENVRRFGWFRGDNMGTAGLCWLLRSLATETQRVVKPTGSLLLFADWRMLPSLVPAVESSGVRYQGLVVWDKGNMGLGNGFRCQHELVMHFTYGDPEYHDKGTANILQCRRVTADDREHQTQKPVDLMRQLIKVVCPPGGVVLDPFCGSGSTGVAALLAGRRFVGIEKDPDCLAVAERRLRETCEMPALFASQVGLFDAGGG